MDLKIKSLSTHNHTALAAAIGVHPPDDGLTIAITRTTATFTAADYSVIRTWLTEAKAALRKGQPTGHGGDYQGFHTVIRRVTNAIRDAVASQD